MSSPTIFGTAKGRDLEMVKNDADPELFKELVHHLSVTTSSAAPISKMTFDQKHEQVNKKIKPSKCYINLVNQEEI